MLKERLNPVIEPARSRRVPKGRLSDGVRAGWFWVARWICRVFCILFFRMRVYGRENVPDKGAFLLVSNHQSYLDPIFCGVPLKRRLCFFARDSLFANWFFRWLISSVNTIPVRRGEADLTAMRKVIGKLKEGWGLCLFPEGTRTNDGRIASLRPGFSLLARRGEAVIVPVVLDGSFECWPRYKKMFSRGSITVCYGKAITVKQTKNMSDRKLAEVLTDTLRRIQNEYRVKQGKKPFEY